MRKPILLAAALALVFAGAAASGDSRPWLPKGYAVPKFTISPDGRYGVMMPRDEGVEPDKLVELKTGRVVAVLAGAYGGWEERGDSMNWGPMQAAWSADSSTLCWVFPDKWFPRSYVALRLRDGKLAWQVELMRPAQMEILTRTQAAAPLNFAVAKMEHDEDGSAYPEGFSVDIADSEDPVAFPLVRKVTLVSDPKGNDEEPAENEISSWLTMTLTKEGKVSFSGFKLKLGSLSRGDVAKARKAAKQVHPLIDTSLGKALLFDGMTSPDGRYAIAWTVRPAASGLPPVDWSRWDEHDPDKLLRRYDWQSYDWITPPKPYEAVNFVVDLRGGAGLELPTKSPYWPGKRDGAELAVTWGSLPDGRRFGLVDNDGTENFWLVTMGGKALQRTDLLPAMKKAVNQLLHERRPMVANPDEFVVSFATGRIAAAKAVTGISFKAEYPESDKRELGLHGEVIVRLTDATVVEATSKARRLDPFADNPALREADGRLNALYAALMKSLPADKADELQKQQRDWIKTRDADADQAVNITSPDLSDEACEQAREKSLLDSTDNRIRQLQKLKAGTR